MKRFFMLCFVILTLTSCGSSAKDNPGSQSVLWDNFSIGTIVEDNAQYLIPGSRQLVGSESGPPEPFTQKQEEMLIQIEPADLPAFITAVRSGIDEAIIKSGASIDGRAQGGVTGTSFSISYREDNIYGVINIWGAPGEGTDYFILMLITEAHE